MTKEQWENIWFKTLMNRGVGYEHACAFFEIISENGEIDLHSDPAEAAALVPLLKTNE